MMVLINADSITMVDLSVVMLVGDDDDVILIIGDGSITNSISS